MTPGLGAALGLAAVLLFWVLGAYNRLMALRSAITRAWQQLEPLLRQRNVAVSGLIHQLRDPFVHEHATLDALLVACTQVDAAATALSQAPVQTAAATELGRADAALATSLGRTLALMAQRPELAAQGDLQAGLRSVQQMEPLVAFGRQLFNQASRHYNQAAQQIPTRGVARLFGLSEAGKI